MSVRALAHRDNHPGDVVAELTVWALGIDVESGTIRFECSAEANVDDVVTTIHFDEHPVRSVIDWPNNIDVEVATLPVCMEVEAGRDRLDEEYAITLRVKDEFGCRVRLV